MRPGADRPRAVLFDIDGTLDSNYLHVEAWHRAFQTFGSPVDAWRIHRDIGMDADQMLADLLGTGADPVVDDLKQEHARLFRQSAGRLRAFDGVRELLLEMTDAGISVVLTPSASSEELELLLETIDVAIDSPPPTRTTSRSRNHNLRSSTLPSAGPGSRRGKHCSSETRCGT